MANGGEGFGAQLVGWALTTAAGVAAGVYGWATWSLRRWTRDEIRQALEEYDAKRRLSVDKQFDDMETQFANVVGALERRDRDHDKQLHRGGERFVAMETNYEHLSRDFYHFRQRFEGGQVKVFRRSPEPDDRENGDESNE